MRKFWKRTLAAAVCAALAVSCMVSPALAATDFTYTYPTEPMDVNSTTGSTQRYLTTLTQRAASEIPLVFGLNVLGGNVFDGYRDMAGTVVNENPDPYMWNFNYLYPDYVSMEEPGEVRADAEELPVGTYYQYLGNELTNSNGLYASGGGNQVYADPVDEIGGVGYAVGYRSDVIIGFSSQLVDQIDLVNSWQEGDEFYQEGDEDYSPLIIDVQTGSVTSRLYSWTEMGQALSAYLEEHPELGVRYGDPYTTAVNLEEFSAGIPYYIAALIADGTIEKKTAAYVSTIDGYTLTCVDPGTLGNVSSDVYAEVGNFNFLTGSFTLSELMDQDVDVLILGATGYGYTGAGQSGQNGATTNSDKQQILSDLAGLGYTADQMPLVMDANTINVKIGNNGYNYSPITCMFVPYVQTYAYMDELAAVAPAINPAAMVQYMVDEFFHVEDSSAADVALYYIGSYWDSVDEEYDQVPDLTNYVYDKDAIVAAIQEGIRYALSGQAEANGNLLLAAYRTTDTAYTLLTESATTSVPADGHDYITLTVDGQTKYLDLTALATQETAGDQAGSGQYTTVRTSYQAIVDYYDSGAYGYGDDLQTTLQKYADRMVAHVWSPDTTAEGTYGYGLAASSGETSFTDVAADAWYAQAVEYVSDQGIMTGTGTGTFSPDVTLGRAQIVQIFYNMEGRPAVSGELPFTDVADTAYYADAVLWAYQNQVVTGISDTTFQPEQTADRQTVATLLYRYAQYKGYDVSQSGDLSAYSDGGQVADWALAGMQWANGTGLITGTSTTTLSPAVQADRAQMATIMMHFCQAFA